MRVNETSQAVSAHARDDHQQLIKCVVWDLDNTIWDGILLEDETVRLRSGIRDVITTLDGRGVLHSIASRNDHERALKKLADFGLREYFIYPQINWKSKASSIEVIARKINFGLDAIAFIDDDPFERGEVSFSHPEVLCIDANEAGSLPAMPQMTPEFLTADSRMRRLMYLSDIARGEAEDEFPGPREEFLATLNMQLSIGPAQEDDLRRVQELTVRTHQLNTTGYTYSYDQLDHFRKSGQHRLLIAGLKDKYGDYGKIGLALIDCTETVWTVKLLLMSCRVVSRGVGTVLLNYLMRQAREQGVTLRAEFVPNHLNRMMYVAYKFAGFREVERQSALVTLECDLARIQPFPDYIKIEP
jgi:FkbH-like protein